MGVNAPVAPALTTALNAVRRESWAKACFWGGQVGFVKDHALFLAAKVFALYLDKWQQKYANYQLALCKAEGETYSINFHSKLFAIYLDEWQEKYANYHLAVRKVEEEA